MELKVNKANLTEIQPFRELFLAESKFQFILNKCHAAGWADTYLFTLDDKAVGYGSVWGKDNRGERDSIFEFFLIKSCRDLSGKVLTEFKKTEGVKFIECQSNDHLLSSMLFEHAKNIQAEAILFEDGFRTNFEIPRTLFLKNEDPEDDIQYFLVQDGERVATGGYVWNYNFPYIDMYYEVMEIHRRKGFGSLITQELKNEAYRLNKVPSARCNIDNKASKATLLKSGMKICGYRLSGELV